MKDFKGNNKLITAFLMLLVTAVALTTASYAWFSTAAAVAIDGIDVNVTAASGIQVSTDAADWKTVLSVADLTAAADDPGAYTGHTNQFASVLAPVSTAGDLSTAGIFDMFYGELVEDTEVTLTTTSLTDTAGYTGHYVAFDVFIKTVEDTDIYLGPTSDVTYNLAGVDAGLQYSARVGFLNKGTDATATPATAVALNSSVEQVIWEPNADQHTDYAINSLGASGVETTYAVIAEGTLLDSDAAVPSATYFDEITALDHGLLVSNEGSTPTTDVIFTAYAGITKLRIYIWIEGQDIDCENTTSLGDGITVTVALTKGA